MVIRFGRIRRVWLVTFNMLDLWPSAWSLLSWQKNLRFPACLCPINTFLFLPSFGRQTEAWVLSFLLCVSSCFCSLFIFPIPLLLVAWCVFGLNLLYNRLSTFFGAGSPELYLYHSKATTEEILVRNRLEFENSIFDNKKHVKILHKNIPTQLDQHFWINKNKSHSSPNKQIRVRSHCSWRVRSFSYLTFPH